MSVTLQDIADQAGIHKSAVSRILRDHPAANVLRPETRERVKKIAARLGYRPNVAAATIRNGFNSSVAALIESGGNQPQLGGVLFRFCALGYSVRRYTMSQDPDEIFRDIEANQIPYLVAVAEEPGQIRAIIGFARKKHLKLVFAGMGDTSPYPCFHMDDTGTFRDMVCRLYAAGHRRIALYCGEHRHPCTERRHRGYLEGLKACSLPADPRLMICSGFDEKTVLDMVEKEQPTAFCCIDGGIAMLLENTLVRHGVKIPKEISLCTYCGPGREVCFAIVPICHYVDAGIADSVLEALGILPEKIPGKKDIPYLYYEEKSIAPPRPEGVGIKIGPDLLAGEITTRDAPSPYAPA